MRFAKMALNRTSNDGLTAETCVIGAGPAGLVAAYELSKAQRSVMVIEKDRNHVGGLSRTVEYKGFRFDIGGHRFFSKNRLVEDLWTEILGERMLVRKRLSRIYYRGKLFRYPLEVGDVLRKLGPREASSCVLSYALAKRIPADRIFTFEEWVTSAFGRRLYEIFFKTYTEKVWGMPCSQISADWAAQRIRGFSMRELIANAFSLGARNSAPIIKTLIDSFRYPRLGPGEMWDTLAEILRGRAVPIHMGEQVKKITRGQLGAASVVIQGATGTGVYNASQFISTMPIRELISALDPPAPAEVQDAAARLQYRDFLMVVLILERAHLFPDQWIYIHDPDVLVGRIQNFGNWSPDMVPDQRHTVLGLEYFCFDSDSLWQNSDEQLIALAFGELSRLELAQGARLVEGVVVRQRAAYPIYDNDYRARVTVVRDFVARELPNLQLVGRNGMHKYNNQDHAMMTGLMAARNVLGESYDPWRVNSDALYLEEEGRAEQGSRLVPERVDAERIAAAR